MPFHGVADISHFILGVVWTSSAERFANEHFILASSDVGYSYARGLVSVHAVTSLRCVSTKLMGFAVIVTVIT